MSQCSLDLFGQAVLSQRIAYVDSYTSFPIPEMDVVYSQHRSREVKRVPVIRIYGPTIHGQKACAHVHGVFPYLYIELDNSVFGLEERLADELDREISASLLEFNSKTAEHVYKIVQVTGRSFYGFKPQSQCFLKIFFYSPIALTKAINILQSGKIFGQRFQPYEAHIPYVLQFFLDFKLHGMNFIHFSNVKFRGSVNDRGKDNHTLFQDLEFGAKVDLERLHRNHFLPEKVSRRSRCELEFDVTVSDILQSNSSTSKNPGIEAIWLDEKERRRQNEMDDWAEITIPISQDRPCNSFLFKRELELRGVLQSKLASHLESINQSKKENRTPTTSYPSSPVLTPSSQVLMEDVALINSDSPAVSQSLSCEWNEEDEEMVSILEEMARNRCIEHDEDSIMNSQVLADFDNDPTMSLIEDSPADEDTTLTNNDADNVGDENEETEDDFFTSEVFELLDKCENEALQQNLVNPSTPSKEHDFKVNQADGQFDSSEDDDDVQFIPQPKPKVFPGNPLKRRRGLPVAGGHWLEKMKSAEDVLQARKKTTIFRSASSSSLSPMISPSPNRVRRRVPPSPPMISSSDDEDVGSNKPTSSAQVPVYNSTSTISPGNPPTPRKRLGTRPSSLLSPIRSLVNRPSSPPLISSEDSSANDSDETNYVPSDTDIPNKNVDGDDQLTKNTTNKSATEIVEVEAIDHNIEDVEEPRLTQSQEGGDSGIRSFYQYPTDIFSEDQDHSTTQEEEQGECSPCPPSQTHSINSFYEYSDTEDANTTPVTPVRSFNNSCQDVCVIQLDSSSEPDCTPPGQVDRTYFLKKAQMSKLKLHKERESVRKLSLRNMHGANNMASSGSSLNINKKIIADISTMNDRRVHGSSVTATTSKAALRQKPVLPEPDFSDSDSEEFPSHVVRGFRFGGSRSDGEDELSSEISDNDSQVVPTPPPRPLPTPSSSRTKLRAVTPKSGSWIARKRRRLNWGSQEGSQQQQHSPGIPMSLDESELDSLSFTSSQSPGLLNGSNYQDVKALQVHQFLRTMSMEVHCSVRGSLVPDPAVDSIRAIFYFLHGETAEVSSSQSSQFGCLMVSGKSVTGKSQNTGSIREFPDELSMIKAFVKIVHENDPDIFVGYEICRFSWGYLIDRGRQLQLDMIAELSRLLPLGNAGKHVRPQEQWNESISGRIVLNLWRLLRHEMTVTSYTFENAVFHILHERVHMLPYRVLADQWEPLHQKGKVISYYKRRVTDVIRIIEKLDLINRTSELARLFGIQFFEVLSRGSQFRVESMMLRLAKAYNLIPPSPSPAQRGGMKAPEYLPLIMEPESKFYKDPVAVLDFQSLYPSMMIGYNYCFSTCIGRVKSIDEGSFEFGCLSQTISLDELNSLFSRDLIHISPCGVAFVKESVQKGVLGEMLEQILDTRQMVKRSMKKWKTDGTLQKVLDSRQLGLKLIANVTYGYTSANFSGRMPCVEIADSVVSKGRETLQRAIDFVKENEDRFHGQVVYGDTDSLFIHFPGITRSEAFKLAQQIVDEVTASNPKPVKLKLEKVYQPCILQTKKRYVGYAYETPDQFEPKYDAKGIETVRRDGCPATAQILKGALKMLFVTQDEKKVKAFVQEQFRKIFMGRVSLSKYTFAREYRGRAGYKPTAVVPSLEIAKRLAEKDPRAEPLRSQRVPYIVVYGDPNLPLIQLIRRPEDFIGNPNLRLNAHYYIEKAIIPPLNRCFSLAKMDVSKWYEEMPRKYLKSHYTEGGPAGTGKKGTIDQYFLSESCIKCESRTKTGFCDACFKNIGEVKDFLNQEESRLCLKFQSCCKICTDCSKEEAGVCINMDCPVKHRYLRYDRDYKTKLPKLQSLSQKLSLAMSAW